MCIILVFLHFFPVWKTNVKKVFLLLYRILVKCDTHIVFVEGTCEDIAEATSTKAAASKAGAAKVYFAKNTAAVKSTVANTAVNSNSTHASVVSAGSMIATQSPGNVGIRPYLPPPLPNPTSPYLHHTNVPPTNVPYPSDAGFRNLGSALRNGILLAAAARILSRR